MSLIRKIVSHLAGIGVLSLFSGVIYYLGNRVIDRLDLQPDLYYLLNTSLLSSIGVMAILVVSSYLVYIILISLLKIKTLTLSGSLLAVVISLISFAAVLLLWAGPYIRYSTDIYIIKNYSIFLLTALLVPFIERWISKRLNK